MPLVARAWAAVRARYPDVDEARLVPELVRDLIGAMVNDVLAETARRCRRASVDRRGARRRPGARRLLGRDGGAGARAEGLPPRAHVRCAGGEGGAAEAQALLAGLFDAYRDDPVLLPEEWRPASGDRLAALRAVGDFIAGMTDRYAVRRHEAVRAVASPRRDVLKPAILRSSAPKASDSSLRQRNEASSFHHRRRETDARPLRLLALSAAFLALLPAYAWRRTPPPSRRPRSRTTSLNDHRHRHRASARAARRTSAISARSPPKSACRGPNR